MKKNTMMRIAAILLVCVLASTCGISGTFAKYVTSDSTEDTARVARWGVTVTTAGELFSKTYVEKLNGNTPGTSNLTVVSADDGDGKKVVAPGTQNDDGMTFTLTGTPEVTVDVKVVVEVKDIVLPANTVAGLVKDYYPVVFTLKNGAGETLIEGTAAQIEEYLKGLTGVYGPNTNLATIGGDNNQNDGVYKLTWKWAFDHADDITTDVDEEELYNKADTVLGNDQALKEVSFKISITITQVD